MIKSELVASARLVNKMLPLAEKVRPKKFEDFVGQTKFFESIRKMVEAGKIPSMIFFGDPGTGKTTLARLISERSGMRFFHLNAGSASVADIRSIVKESNAILFLDEIHRFSKSQQDILLPYVEDGRLILIGATTENPFFEVNRALLSRVRLIRFEKLSSDDILKILEQACENENISAEKTALDMVAKYSDGDARIALNVLEQLETFDKKIEPADVENLLGDRILHYDKKDDNHYDVISAFIKSMRGSDPDAAVHYLARMLSAGEDPKFIARRVAICAAEDVGLADPFALVLAMSAVDAVNFIGMPEARIPLVEAVIYVATAKKSNAAYLAIDRALSDVKNRDCGDVPNHLRDSHSSRGFQKGYKYPHDYPGHFVPQKYLPEKISDVKYYEPTEIGYEKRIADYLRWRDQFEIQPGR